MTESAPAPGVSNETARLTSMDAYRGFVMVCLAANGFGLNKLAKQFPDNATMKAIGYQFDHVPWVGCAFWDLIQPSFMFLVGVALPFSCARREKTGASKNGLLKHALIRSFILILLGIFLSSIGQKTTNFAFMNVLTQIGLGYSFLYLVKNRYVIVQVLIAAAILGGYWAWFALTPAVAIENKSDHHLPDDWVLLEGFQAHWQKNANPAAAFDQWFLNLFPPQQAPAEKPANPPATPAESTATNPETPKTETPAEPKPPGVLDNVTAALRRLVTRPEPYVFNAGGYQTLNFIPSFVTMLLGLMAGELIRRENASVRKKFLLLVIFGLLLLGLGYGWHAYGGCPLVKRIWTPSWTLFSTGWTLLILAGFYGIIDGLGWKAWSFPLVVAGMNSMVLYLLGQLLRPWTAELLKRHINENLFLTFGAAWSPVVEATCVLLCFWLFVYWLYRQRIFVRI